MADEEAKRPIIIKKIKKGGHAHHGGAWKVAYADFVTAMMAFFLMLWLLASASDAQLEGLAEYFTPTIGVKDSMGIGFAGGESPEKDGIKKTDLAPPGIVVGQPPQGLTPEDPTRDTLMEAEKDAKLFEKAEEAIKQAFESDPNMRDLSENIIVEQSPEGLKIDITDSDKHPMFETGRTSLTVYGQRTLSKMYEILKDTPNFISLTGHTDITPFGRNKDYTNWELSADRANTARRYLVGIGMDPERPKKVVGMADAELLLPELPKSPRNRRISIILLRGAYMDLQPGSLPATRDLLTVPGSPSRRETAPPPAAEPIRNPNAPAPDEALMPKVPATVDMSPAGAIPRQTEEPATITPPQNMRNPEQPNVGIETTPPAAKPELTPQDVAPFVDE